jgi:A/G-specific adenine glycosylase
MAALPGSEWSEAPPAADPLASVRHVFTHFSLDLGIELRSEPVGEGWWQSIESLSEAGLPTLYRKAADRLLSGRRALAA